jgi:hypothetical protein
LASSSVSCAARRAASTMNSVRVLPAP